MDIEPQSVVLGQIEVSVRIIHARQVHDAMHE